MSTLRAPMLVALLVTAAFAGCFAAKPDADEPTFQISRAHTITLDAEKARELGNTDGPEEFVRALVDTSLVVRVAEGGDYTLAYTDERGRAKTETLTGLQPGTPRAVAGADPFAGATLSRGSSVVALRSAVDAGWWQVGDVPLGLQGTAPASTTYGYKFDARAEAALSDVRAKDGSGRLDSLVARVAMPATGEFSWNLAREGALERLDLNARMAIDDSRGSLFFFELIGEMQGEAGTVGAELLSGNAGFNGGVSLWLRDGRMSAGQFQGGRAHADPDLVVWATGFAAENGEFPCAGKTRADKCSPEQLESFDESEPAGEREEFDDNDFEVSGEEERAALRLLERILGMDLGLHDKLTITVSTTADEVGMAEEGSDFAVELVQEVEVVAKERIDLPAGSFEAYRIVQTARVNAQVDKLVEQSCVRYGQPDYNQDYSYAPGSPPPPPTRYHDPWGCEEYETREYMNGFRMSEVLARSTLWLDAKTYQPLAGSVESPLDVGKVLRDVVDAADPDFWTNANLEAFDSEKLSLRATSEARFEATKLAGAARFSPAVGFLMGSVMLGTWGAGISPGFLGMGYGGAMDAVEVQPTSPPASISLASNGPIQPDGSKSYTVASASPGLDWSRISVSVDGSYRSFSYAESCDAGAEWEFVACSGGEVAEYFDPVYAGDTLHLPAVQQGQTLRLIDSWSNSVMMTITIT